MISWDIPIVKIIFLAFFMKILSVYLKTAIGSRFPELILLD